jgi:hypothetical protein
MTGQPLIEREKNPAAEALRRMADHVERNAGAGFGGCVVIVPPEGGGDPIELLTICDTPDLTQFFGNISARITARVTELELLQQQRRAFGPR